MVFNSVLDLILAQRAQGFVICTRQFYEPFRYCRVCNVAGYFAEYAMELRRRRHQPENQHNYDIALSSSSSSSSETLPCWPQAQQDVQDLISKFDDSSTR